MHKMLAMFNYKQKTASSALKVASCALQDQLSLQDRLHVGSVCWEQKQAPLVTSQCP